MNIIGLRDEVRREEWKRKYFCTDVCLKNVDITEAHTKDFHLVECPDCQTRICRNYVAVLDFAQCPHAGPEDHWCLGHHAIPSDSELITCIRCARKVCTCGSYTGLIPGANWCPPCYNTAKALHDETRRETPPWIVTYSDLISQRMRGAEAPW